MKDDGLVRLQQEVDHVDQEILKLIGFRIQLSRMIGEYKKEQGMSVLDKKRTNEVIRHWAQLAKKFDIDEESMGVFLEQIDELCHRIH